MSNWFATSGFAAIFAVVALCLPAQAQVIDLAAQHSVAGTAAMNAVLAGTGPTESGGISAASLNLVASPRAEQAAVDRMIVLLSAQEPENGPQLREMYEGGELQDSFVEVMKLWGLDSNNLGDVTAAFYLALWQVLNDKEATAPQILAVRDQLLPALLAQPALTGATQAQKEDEAAYLSLLAITILRGYIGNTNSGATDRNAALQQSILEGLATQGLDLGTVDLTDAGFVRRDPA